MTTVFSEFQKFMQDNQQLIKKARQVIQADGDEDNYLNYDALADCIYVEQNGSSWSFASLDDDAKAFIVAFLQDIVNNQDGDDNDED